MYNDYPYDKYYGNKGPSVWQKIAKLEVKDSAKFAKLFAETASRLQAELGDFKEHIEDGGDFLLVFEGNRASADYIHFVPKEAWPIFREMQINSTHEYFGVSILLGRRNNKELRLGCIGIPTSMLQQELSKLGPGSNQEQA